MGWFRRKASEFEHPLFGGLKLGPNGAWFGTVDFGPVGHPIQIQVPDLGGAPVEWGSGLFQELQARFPGLERTLSEAIFRLYTSEMPRGAPDQTDVGTMATLLRLEDASLETPSCLRLGYAFAEGTGWDDASFSVELTDWAVTSVWLDD